MKKIISLCVVVLMLAAVQIPVSVGGSDGSAFSMLVEKVYAATEKDEKKVYNYLTKSMDLNMAAACGVMTNLEAESGMRSNNLENIYNIAYGLSDEEYTKRVNKGKKNKGKYKSGFGKTRYFTKDYSGYGLCQWTSLGRRQKLLNMAVKKDVSIANVNMQLEFMKGELKKSYPQVWATLENVPDNDTGAYLAAVQFCAVYEIPWNTNYTAGTRGKKALKTFWKKYSGKAGSVNGKSHMGICGYTYPVAIKKGSGMTVSGHVISNYKIKSISVKIISESGKTVYKASRKPYAKISSLYKFDKSMKFSKLSAGTYTYVITTKDTKGKSITAKHEFTVSKSNEQEVERGCAVKSLKTYAE